MNFTHNNNGINANHRKEKHFSHSLITCAVVDGKIEQVIDMRFYTTQSRVYCCMWVHFPNFYASGSGYAGGYGYHRESAAAAEAIKNAGFELGFDIDGRGDTAIEDALRAITKFVTTVENCTIIRAHG